MDGRDRNETDDRTNEGPAEGERVDKHRRDPLGTVIWALILIWAGLVLLAENAGWLDAIAVAARDLPFGIPFVGGRAWTLIFAGIGVLLVIEAAVRLLVPSYRREVFGSLIGAAVMFGLAFGDWAIIWPLILVAIGLNLLLRAFARRGGGD